MGVFVDVVGVFVLAAGAGEIVRVEPFEAAEIAISELFGLT